MVSSKEYRDFVLEQFDMVPGLSDFGMSEAIPYEGGKAMYLVECVDKPELLAEIVEAVVDELK